MLIILVALLQKAKPTVNETLSGPYNLVVGLNCDKDGTCSASGNLTVDSHTKFAFNASEHELHFQSDCINTTSSPILENITVYGLNVTACLNISTDHSTGARCNVIEENQVLEIKNLQLDLCSTENGQIQWEVTDIPQSTTIGSTTSAPTTEPETPTVNPETTTEPDTPTVNPETTTELETPTVNPETTTELEISTSELNTISSETTTEPPLANVDT
jgi:hypothetical protein